MNIWIGIFATIFIAYIVAIILSKVTEINLINYRGQFYEISWVFLGLALTSFVEEKKANLELARNVFKSF